jgi:macrolide transport system ATP-binding/permease protein
MSYQLSLHEITKSYNHRVVLDRVSCAFPPGQVSGLIGENGSGKSTLLRIMAGVDAPDDGEVTVAESIGFLAQDISLPLELSVAGVADHALSELRAIQARMLELEAVLADGDPEQLEEYGELQTAFQVHDGYDAEARFRRALAGLGLSLLSGDRLLSSLSGGEQARLHLAAVLVAVPEVLLLDEPTNHLDLSATEWLEDHLRARTGTTVVVSHDRAFLERVAPTLFEVDGDTHQLTRYSNGYAGYLTEKAADRARIAQARQTWEDEVAGMQETVRTTADRVAYGRGMTDNNKMAYDRASGRVAQAERSKIRNAKERLRRLEEDPPPIPSKPLRFTASLQTAGLDGVLLEAAGVSVRDRLRPTSIEVAKGDRLLITGPNGIGKSTLLEVLTGVLAADTGTVERRGRVGYLAQEVVETQPDRTLREELMLHRGAGRLGLFQREQLHTRVSNLSTGQRRRLALVELLTRRHDVLVLDEPTNHLSLVLVEELEAALGAYDGALVVVSHDRRFVSRWRGEVLELKEDSYAKH